VNVLDENVPRDQSDLLRHWGIRFRSVSRDLGYQGISDDNIRPLLLRLKRPTLLTRDGDFFRRDFVHARYCLVWFDVAVDETAFFIRRFLRQRLFRTDSQRLGKVIRAQPLQIQYWTRTANRLVEVGWQTDSSSPKTT